MPETPTPAAVPVPPAVLVLAVRCALSQRTHDDDLVDVSLALFDHVDHLPTDVLRELDNRITYWLDEHPSPSLAADTWLRTLESVRQAREETPR